MTTKHKPATPLPWKYGELSQNIIGQRGQLIAECVEADFDDAAYISHAANAYPKLVAALRGEYPDQPLYGQWAQERFESGFAHDRKTYNAEMTYALLRELGEAE